MRVSGVIRVANGATTACRVQVVLVVGRANVVNIIGEPTYQKDIDIGFRITRQLG